MKKMLLIVCCVMFAAYSTGFAQNFSSGSHLKRNCGAMEHLTLAQQTDPSLIKRMQEIENFTKRAILERQQEIPGPLGAIRIPVVVHVVYNTPVQNISDVQVQSQIAVLNEDFRKLNTDVSNTPDEFAPLAADVGIEFFLATVDPDGNPTNGITRTATDKKKFGLNDNIKRTQDGGKDPWPTDKYLNLWTGNISYILGELLGYAQFPGGDPATDGVVINSKYFGREGSALAPFDGGRTATHEVGHWLNLRHIWGDGGCGATDFVDDTPDAQSEYYGCPAYPSVSCGSSDMFMNFMDYVDDNCMVMFSQGQRERMLALFEPGGARESFVTDDEPSAYCASQSLENLAWIEGVRINTTTNVSGSDMGYGDYTSSPVILVKGNTYLFGAQAKFANKKAALNWRFWIDYNQDGDFEDVGEMVFEGKSANIAKKQISIPGSAADGVTRVRISAKYGSYPSPCESFQYGEVEDYAVNITSDTATFAGSALELYPNPSHGLTNINLNLGSQLTSVSIQLSDSRGKAVFSKTFNDVKGAISHSINTSGLRKGVYYVSVKSGAVNGVKKLIIE